MANIESQHNETEFETFEFIRSKNHEENEMYYSYRSAYRGIYRMPASFSENYKSTISVNT